MYSLKLQYNGNTVTSAGGSFVHFDYAKPYFVFEFADADYTPTALDFNSENYTGTWTQVSSSPNQWKLEIDEYVDYIENQSHLGVGLVKLFMRDLMYPTLTMSCKLIESGGFDYKDRNGNVCESMDRLFGECSGLTSISTIECTTVTNVNGMFLNCSNVESGTLDQYNWFLNNGNITSHAGTFKNCGASTQTGLAELNQIPFGWGGKLYPVSTGMSAKKENTSTSWKITANNPTWTDVKNGMYMFTTSSVSRYEGVSMNRSRLYNKINAFSNATTVDEYYYPAFIQIPGIPGSSTTYQPTWIVTTETYNDMLQAGASNRDMAGTLDFEAYGQFVREYGTYDSNSDVHFVFLVTNTPIENWAGLTGEMAFLFNSNYNNSITLNWFFET